jgi:hypothetical protein
VTGGHAANADINIFGGKWNSTTGTGDCTSITFVHSSRCQVRDAALYNENQCHHIETNGCDYVLIEHRLLQWRLHHRRRRRRDDPDRLRDRHQLACTVRRPAVQQHRTAAKPTPPADR